MLKRNFVKAVLSALLCCMLVLPLACGKEIQGIDPNKTQIYVYAFNSGIGTEYLEAAAKDFNENGEFAEDYEVIIVPTTNGVDFAPQYLSSNGGSVHVYFLDTMYMEPLIEGNYVADLSDIWASDVDGKGKTVAEKMHDSAAYRNLFSGGSADKVYALPVQEAPYGLIFDYQLFLDNGWLIYKRDASGNLVYEDGKPVLSDGPDGKGGTLDDGQPANLAEWEQMMRSIVDTANSKGFVYTTKYEFYMDQVLFALLAQYAGEEGITTFLNNHGNYTDAQGNTVSVGIEEGWKVYQMPGIDRSVNFLKDYLVNKKYVANVSWDTTDVSHEDADNAFIMGFMPKNEQIAFLMDGCWWESSSKSLFDNIESRGYADRGYGDREYRYMLFPKLDGQQTEGSLLSLYDSASVVVSNDQNPEIVRVSKEFVKYTCKDEYLRLFTSHYGTARPFDYELGEVYGTLTPFQKNTWDILHDDSVTLVSKGLAEYRNGKQYKLDFAASSSSTFSANVDTSLYIYSLTPLRRFTAQQYIDGMRAWNQSKWQGVTVKPLGAGA